MDASTLISLAVGSVISASVTLAAAHWYYQRASADLRQEMEKPILLLQVLVKAVEEQGFTIKRDGEGNPTIEYYTGSGNAKLPPLTASGTGTYTPPSDT